MKHDANCARLKSTKACDCGLWGEAEIKAHNARLMTTPSAPMTGERMKEIEARHERYTAWIAQRGAGHLEREMHKDRSELLAELKRRSKPWCQHCGRETAVECEDCARILRPASAGDGAEIVVTDAQLEEILTRTFAGTGYAFLEQSISHKPKFSSLIMQAMREAALTAKAPKVQGSQEVSESARDGVPDGWQLVPIEPTEEMIEAYAHEGNSIFFRSSTAKAQYKAMLAVAPRPTNDGSYAR